MASIIWRSEWGARPARSVSRTAWTGNTLWVHHSAGPKPGSTPEAEKAAVRGIQSFHQGPSRGWSDIGYGYLIAPDSGRIYEGRGANVWAAHCPGHNDEPSVCIIGTFDREAPSLAARRAVWELADHIGMTRLAGHRQGFSTSCPGDALMEAIVTAPRPGPPRADPKPKPHGDTLRLVVNNRAWAGWDDCEGPLRWIKHNPLRPGANVALAYNGHVRRDHREVRLVAATLVNRFLGG